jgi:hypothetical protein
MRQFQIATLGFPFVYLHSNDERRMWALLAANIAIGIAGWLVLYGLMAVSHRERHSCEAE